MADLALLVLASQALSDLIAKKDVRQRDVQELRFQPLVLPPITSLEADILYTEAVTDNPMWTYEQWLQRNPGGNFVRYSKYVTGLQ